MDVEQECLREGEERQAPKSALHPQSRFLMRTGHDDVENGHSEASHARKKFKRSQGRALTACETCRKRKVKCNAGVPSCIYCKSQGFHCEYKIRNGASQNHWISNLLSRLAQAEGSNPISISTEKRINDQIEPQVGDKIRTQWPSPKVDIPTPNSSNITSFGVSCQSSTPTSIDYYSNNPSPTETLEISSGVETNCRPISTAIEAKRIQKEQIGNSTFISNVELEYQLDIASIGPGLDQPSELMPCLEFFFQNVVPLFPVICDVATYKMVIDVQSTGFQDNIFSCLILMSLALSKVYKFPRLQDSGLAEFQRAIRILSTMDSQCTLEYAQAQVLAALFFMKKARLMDFWSYLHSGCCTLYTTIMRDKRAGIEKSLEDTKTTLRLYWICYNLERDVIKEFDTSPKSLLYLLEDSLQLPLGCDELNTTHLAVPVRTTYTYFLAEMSLKAIIAQMLSTANLENSVQRTPNGTIETSPLIQEFKFQLDEWVDNVPSFLNWSLEAGKGILSVVGTRLKLLYWFARFSLFQPLITSVLRDSNCTLPLLGWTAFQEGILAGLEMVKVSFGEESDVDLVMSNRLVTVVIILKEAAGKGSLAALRQGRDICVNLEDCVNMLWRRSANNSEWIACRLHTL